MKRIFCLILALVLVAALFTGCGKTDAPTPTPTPDSGAQQTPDAAGEVTDTPDPTPEPAAYLFAPGNYETDEKGWPTNYYTYDSPFCLVEETLSYWTVNWTPQILPAEGMDGIDFCIAEQEATGVDIEYIVVPSETRTENFSVLLAADDLPDLMNQADMYYPGTEIDAIEEGYFANIYDYKEYCPNYLYHIISNKDTDKNLYDQCFLDNTHISKFMGMSNMGGMDATVIAVRADWLDKLGINKDDLDTIEEYTAVAELMRTELGATYPLSLISDCLDSGSYLGCYDTYTTLSSTYVNAFPSPHVENGEVVFYFSDDNSKKLVEHLSQWVADGLITPNWMNNTDGETNVANGIVGICTMPVSTLSYYEAISTDPDCRWEVLKKPSLFEGQVHHLGISKGLCNGFGRTQISASCENIPLAVTWCDWRYSPEGSELSAWGVEGRLWEYDANGRKVATEWAYNNPDGQIFGFLQCTYSSNFLAEHGLGDATSAYCYPGGEKALEYFDYWYQVEYDGAYEWPKGIALTEDQSAAFMAYVDIDTYICENILAFVSGVKPISEWDAYVAQLSAMGIEEAEAIYQEAYDAYQLSLADREF
ncbi:MAG: hypothetical protein IKL27_04360 [Oscillospiraceae bacterium]|nr:hypothetical protein [Oscillospiraceae bacterium]